MYLRLVDFPLPVSKGFEIGEGRFCCDLSAICGIYIVLRCYDLADHEGDLRFCQGQKAVYDSEVMLKHV